MPYPERAGFLEVDGVFCDYERRDAAALFAAIGLRPSGHQENLADTRVGDEQLGAVQHIMVALFFGNGLRAAGIRARPGLRQPEAAEHAARGQMGNESFLLLLRPKVHDGGRTEGRVSRNGDRVAGIHLGQLLDDDQVGRVVHARATEKLRPGRAQKPEFCHLFHGLPREPTVLVVFPCNGPDLLLRKMPNDLAHSAVVVGEIGKISHGGEYNRLRCWLSATSYQLSALS